MRRIVITGPQPVDMLDLVGPLEVFKFAPEYEVVVASPEGTTELQLNHGFKISDAVPFTKLAAQIDTLVVAGGPGANDELYDDEYLHRIIGLASRSRRVAGICTGTFVLAAAGLLNGKRAVTHWAYCDKLSRKYPSVLVEPDRIYLRDGSIYTSAGITAGMDLALALVEEDHGHQVALEIARILVMFLVRPGGQSQYSHMLSRQAATSQPLRELQVWMIENLRENLSVERLAKRMGMSSRNFTRVCLRETRMNPGQFVDRMRVEAAQQLIDSSAMGLKEIADACGFQAPLAMRRTFIRVLGITAGEYASRFKRSQSQRFQRDYNGKQPGDPKKAAQAIVRLTQEQKPPLRLLLGSDAYNGAEKNDLARLEEARSWKELSVSTDFESKPPHPGRPK